MLIPHFGDNSSGTRLIHLSKFHHNNSTANYYQSKCCCHFHCIASLEKTPKKTCYTTVWNLKMSIYLKEVTFSQKKMHQLSANVEKIIQREWDVISSECRAFSHFRKPIATKFATYPIRQIGLKSLARTIIFNWSRLLGLHCASFELTSD